MLSVSYKYITQHYRQASTVLHHHMYQINGLSKSQLKYNVYIFKSIMVFEIPVYIKCTGAVVIKLLMLMNIKMADKTAEAEHWHCPLLCTVGIANAQ